MSRTTSPRQQGLLSSNTSIQEALISAGDKCFEDLFLSFVSRGVIKVGNKIGEKYFNIIRKKLEVSPEFVPKRLLKYGINKIFIESLSESITKAIVKQQIDKAIYEYEQGKTE